MRRPSIKIALATTITVLLIMLALLSWSSISAMSRMGVNNDAIVQKWMPSISRSKQIAIAMSSLRIAYRNHVLATGATAKQAAEQQIAESTAAIKAAIDDYSVLATEPDQQSDLLTLRTDLDAYNKAGGQLEIYSRNGQEDAARAVLADSARYAKSIDTIINRIVADNQKQSDRDGQENRQLISRSIATAYLLSGLSLTFGLAAVAFAIRGISRPIGRITHSMKMLAGGDTATAIPFSERSDEIGAMAAAVEIFRQAAIANRRLEAEAEAARSKADADRTEAQEHAEADASERLRVATAGLADGLRQLSAGDLSVQLNEAFASDFEALRHDFNQSARQLSVAFSDISTSISALDDGTREIASGANDLSRRTEQQAAALEQTAAALDEITATVASATRLTENARALAVQADHSAAKSAQVVSDAEEAMKRIESSSQQISSIIGVIDEIAFQTNLLALNAGVEAARAGEAGKGFAVVAQEVRELAQRSAQAAREIKQLIGASSREVSSGVELVRATGDALKTIGGFIGDISTHMTSIATSAKEQSTGLAEVNAAVNAMDQTTQQNAAMVEQSTAASNGLALEAEKLRNLVDRFKVGTGHSVAQAGQTRQRPHAA